MNESRHYPRFVLFVLILVALFNYIDRQSLAILQIPIKAELGLSDTQLGSLTGLSFALLYSTLALPIARLADRTRRVRLIAAALGVWSLMTAASGLAVGMLSLTACRMGVAVGEAGCVPATHTLLSDYFSRAQRATAIAIWSMSFPVGTMLGFFAGGWLSHAVGWRSAFYILGISGLVLIPVVLLVREPVRGRLDGAVPSQAVVPVRESLRMLWSLKSYRHATFGGALVAYTMYATLTWNAPFYNRVFGLTMPQIATHLALLSGIGSGLGVYFGGFLADRLGRRDKRWYMWVPGIAAGLAVPFVLVQYLYPEVAVSLPVGYLPAMLLSSFFAPLVATAQSLVPSNQRAFTSAVLVLVVNIIGIGLGPLVTGIISDLLASRFGLTHDSLRYALVTAIVPALWGCAHLLRSASYLPAELPDRPPVGA